MNSATTETEKAKIEAPALSSGCNRHAQLINNIERKLGERLDALGIKHGSAKARTEEAAFLCGAMQVIHDLYPNANPDRLSELCPPRWIFAPMSGQSVLTMDALEGDGT